MKSFIFFTKNDYTHKKGNEDHNLVNCVLCTSLRSSLLYMATVLCLFILVGFLSCSQGEPDPYLNYNFSIVKTDFDQIRKIQDSIDYNFRLNFQVVGDTVEIFGVLGDGTPFLFNNHKPLKHFPNTSLNYRGYSIISLCNGFLLYASENKNAIKKIDLDSGESLITYEGVLDQGEYIMGNMYSQDAFQCVNDSAIVFQFGSRNETVNFMGDHLFKVLTPDSIYNFIKTPEVFYHEYHHYNDLSVVFQDGLTFIVFPTLGYLFQYDGSGELQNQVNIPGNFISFDEEEVTNPLYIHDYTYETSYNIRLMELGPNKLGLLQRIKEDLYCVHYFSINEADYIGSVKLPFKPYYYYIHSDADTLNFGLPHLNKLHKITLVDEF